MEGIHGVAYPGSVWPIYMSSRNASSYSGNITVTKAANQATYVALAWILFSSVDSFQYESGEFEASYLIAA